MNFSLKNIPKSSFNEKGQLAEEISVRNLDFKLFRKLTFGMLTFNDKKKNYTVRYVRQSI